MDRKFSLVKKKVDNIPDPTLDLYERSVVKRLSKANKKMKNEKYEKCSFLLYLKV